MIEEFLGGWGCGLEVVGYECTEFLARYEDHLVQ